MTWDVLPARELSAEVCSAWERLCAGNPELTSPYFSPRFAVHVGAVRSRAMIGVYSESGQIRAVLPFERGVLGLGRPIAGPVSDYQALIAAPGFEMDPREVVRGCGLSAWCFDHLLASQTAFAPFHTRVVESPVLDLSGGYEAYIEARKAEGSQEIRNLPRKARKMEREVGPIRFEARSTDREAMAALLRWKSEQCLATSHADVFKPHWTRDLVERIWGDRTDSFEGILSTLHAGDTLVAAHFGMRSSTVWHWWFPVYNHEHAQYSPGIILLMKMAEVAPSMGLNAIDFGKGDSEYKNRLKNRAVLVAEGAVELPSVLRTLRSVRRSAELWADRGALGVPIKLPLKALARWERSRKFA